MWKSIVGQKKCACSSSLCALTTEFVLNQGQKDIHRSEIAPGFHKRLSCDGKMLRQGNGHKAQLVFSPFKTALFFKIQCSSQKPGAIVISDTWIKHALPKTKTWIQERKIYIMKVSAWLSFHGTFEPMCWAAHMGFVEFRSLSACPNLQLKNPVLWKFPRGFCKKLKLMIQSFYKYRLQWIAFKHFVIWLKNNMWYYIQTALKSRTLDSRTLS